ncbi:glycolate oxidase FAD binding subunit [Burkholderia sp. OK233]|jgi:glycolate oxidase FAD binding subunit|nr:glycolate oxidase FAD binding subunit [Burkholderia sp. OK233]
MTNVTADSNLAKAETLDSPVSSVQDHFRVKIEEAYAHGHRLCIRGGGSKDWYGAARTGEVLDTRAYRGVVAYDPAELVITARSGTPLAEIEQLLSSHQQMLAFEPPHFGPGATFGGCIATGLAGPRRMSAGAVRDFLLGASILTGRGELLRFGGQVMKNVAGYDVARLMAGSLGTLGLLMDISVKVLPKPPASATLRQEMDACDAVRKLNEWAGRPLPITASSWHAGVLTFRLEGATAALRAACATMGGDTMDDPAAAMYWHLLREQNIAFFQKAPVGAALWRLCVPSTTEPALLRDVDSQLIEWGGSQRWLFAAEDDDSLRRGAVAAGGHATQFRYARTGIDVFTALSAPVAGIHKRLKTAFDPAGVFNHGRMFVGM